MGVGGLGTATELLWASPLPSGNGATLAEETPCLGIFSFIHSLSQYLLGVCLDPRLSPSEVDVGLLVQEGEGR